VFVQSDIQLVGNDATRTNNDNSELNLMKARNSDKVGYGEDKEKMNATLYTTCLLLRFESVLDINAAS
jgi:hypothetical protein